MPLPFAHSLSRLDAIYRDRPHFAGVKARLLVGVILLLFAIVTFALATLLWLKPLQYIPRIAANAAMGLTSLVALRLLFRGQLILAGNVMAIALIVPANTAALLPLWHFEPVALAVMLFAYNLGFLLMAIVFASRRVAFVLAGFIAASQIALYFSAHGNGPAIAGSLEFTSRTLLRDGLLAIVFIFFLGMTVLRMIESAHHRSEEALRETRALNENLEQLVAARTRELVRLNDEKNAFLGMAAHDLRNPAVKIRMTAEMIDLEGDYSEPRVRTDLASIIQTATRMLRLLSDLLDVNAIEEGKVALRPTALDAGALVREIHADFLDRAAAKGIAFLLVAPPPSTPAALPVLVDAAAIRQVLDNLVSNALKFSPPGKRVWLSADATADGRVRFAVRDEGPGLSEADRAKLFGKYSRLSAQPTGGETSNGLGLSIVKRLVEGMSGTIAVDSVLGQGATFRADFPAAAPSSPLTSPA